MNQAIQLAALPMADTHLSIYLSIYALSPYLALTCHSVHTGHVSMGSNAARLTTPPKHHARTGSLPSQHRHAQLLQAAPADMLEVRLCVVGVEGDGHSPVLPALLEGLQVAVQWDDVLQGLNQPGELEPQVPVS